MYGIKLVSNFAKIRKSDYSDFHRALLNFFIGLLLGETCSISPTYLCTAFTPVAPKSVTIQSSCQYLFTLLGSTGAKAARRTLMKLTPDFFTLDIADKHVTMGGNVVQIISNKVETNKSVVFYFSFFHLQFASDSNFEP